MKNATLRQLKVFECVARHLSFTRAAEECILTQPAVSTQVKELESHAGLPLFEHLGERSNLTQAGAEMLHHSRAIIQAVPRSRRSHATPQGHLGRKAERGRDQRRRLFFPRLLAEFARRNSGVILNLTVQTARSYCTDWPTT